MHSGRHSVRLGGVYPDELLLAQIRMGGLRNLIKWTHCP